MSESPTILGAGVSLAGASILQALAALYATDTKTTVSNATGSGVCMVALLHYYWMSLPGSDVMSIRYSDWFITLPFLLLDIFLICGIDLMENLGFFLVACLFLMVMLIAGWKALQTQSVAWLALGCLCLLVVYGIVFGVLSQTEQGPLATVTRVFFLLWILYGVVAVQQYRSSSENSGSIQAVYDVLDITTKAVFGVVVASSVLCTTV